MIKNILLVTLLFSFSLGSMDTFAKKNNYFLNYEQAKQNALKTQKPLMLVLVTNTCPWCEKLEKQTLSKETIHNFVSNNFTPLVLNRDKANYPIEKFKAKVVPTVFFIDPQNETIIHSSFGYKSKKKFLTVLEETVAKNKGK